MGAPDRDVDRAAAQAEWMVGGVVIRNNLMAATVFSQGASPLVESWHALATPQDARCRERDTLMRLYINKLPGEYQLKGMDDTGKIVVFATARNQAAVDKLYKLAWTLDRHLGFVYAPVD
jgi:hypothetical protein